MSSHDDPKATGPAQTPPPSRLSPTTPHETPARPTSAAPSAGAPDPAPQRSGAPASGTSEPDAGRPAAPAQRADAQAGTDPLRGSKASGFWATVIALLVVLVLLAVFVLQNTQSVEISFFGWSGSAPLAAAMMIAAAAGLIIAIGAGTLRILQLRRRVKRVRKADKKAAKAEG